jgi:hypothetical protein
MANFASLRGPVGLNRVYVKVKQGGPLDVEPWLDGLKRGRTFATNGPLLGFSMEGHDPGDELKLPQGTHEVKFKAWMRSIVPIDHLEIICNGKIVREVKLAGDRQKADEDGAVSISETGWCLLRAVSDKAEYPVLDWYPYATTSPIYVTVDGSRPHPKEDAEYFIAWIDQLISGAQTNHDWNSDAEKLAVIDQFTRARGVYQNMLK